MTSTASSSRSVARRPALVAALALAGCTPYSLSPPARALPLESSATLAEGESAVQVSGGLHNGLGPVGGSGEVSVRHGLLPQLELQLDGSYSYVQYPDERSPHIGAGRAGLKVAPVEHLAFVAGVGAGGAAHGAFVSPDAGLILAYENPYLVPWAAIRGFVSVPIGPSTVTVSEPNADGPPTLYMLVPPNTIGWQASTGVRLPIPLEEPGLGLDLLGGVGLMGLYSLEGPQAWYVVQGSLALRFRFDSPPDPPR